MMLGQVFSWVWRQGPRQHVSLVEIRSGGQAHDFIDEVIGGSGQIVQRPRAHGQEILQDSVYSSKETGYVRGNRLSRVRCRSRGVVMGFEQKLQQHLDIVPGREQNAAIARHQVIRWKINWPTNPLTVDLLHEGNEALLLESLLPRCHRLVRWPAQFFVALADCTKCVLVEPKPDVQPVLQNSLPVVQVATAGAFTTQTPAHLVHGDLILLLPAGFLGQAKGSSDTTDASAQDRNLLPGTHRDCPRMNREGNFCFLGTFSRCERAELLIIATSSATRISQEILPGAGEA